MVDTWNEESVRKNQLTWESEERREELELARGELAKDLEEHSTVSFDPEREQHSDQEYERWCKYAEDQREQQGARYDDYVEECIKTGELVMDFEEWEEML